MTLEITLKVRVDESIANDYAAYVIEATVKERIRTKARQAKMTESDFRKLWFLVNNFAPGITTSDLRHIVKTKEYQL